MRKEIKYFGHTASPSDYEIKDGDIAAALDLWPDEGAIRPTFEPAQLLSLGDNYKVIYVHETSKFRHYILYNTATKTLYWMEEENTYVYMDTSISAETLISANAIGNTVVVLTDKGIHYYLWKPDSSSYLVLGTTMPECPISFGLRGEMKRTEPFSISFDSIAEGDIFEEFSDDNKTKITEQVLAKVNKFIAEESVEKGRFIFPFLVRYAYRLYDGNLTMHSAPVLMVCSSDLTPQVYYEHITGRKAYTDAELRVVGVTHILDYAVADPDAISELRKWSDIIKSVDIFVSAPIYTYDQAGECTRFTNTDDNQAFSICKLMNQKASTTTYPLRYQYNRFSRMYAGVFDPDTFKYPVGSLALPRKSADAVKEAIKDCSTFYLLDCIKVENLKTVRTPIEVKEDYLQSLLNREVMTDDYDSHDQLLPQYSFAYNSRLNLAGMKKRLFKGFAASSLFNYSDGYVTYDPDDPLLLDGVNNVYVYVFIKQDGKDIVVQGGYGSANFNTPLLFFYYPNTNAYKALIVRHSYFATVYEVPLEAHNHLNGAFYFGGWSQVASSSVALPAVSTDEQRTVEILNKIYTSEVNNPFLYPVLGINTVGTGKVLGISTAAKALSQGQFGQFPLYAFTDDGVWALEVSATGGYSARQPITRDVCVNADSITQIDSAVLFATDRGIMLISGSQTTCITDSIDDLEDGTFQFLDLPAASELVGDNADDALALRHVSFKTFLEGCGMIYSYPMQSIIVFNPDCRYAYLYSLKSKSWGQIRSSITSAVNSYPEALAMAGNKLLDYSKRVAYDPVDYQYLVTRPLKLDAPDMLKTVDAVIQRGRFARGHVQTLLYGSRDLNNWYLISTSVDHFLRGFHGTPYRYFRIMLRCQLTNTESIAGCTIEYRLKDTNQLR